MKKNINKKAIAVGILTAITVSLFASVLVVYGKDQDRKAEKAAIVEAVALKANVLTDVNKEVQKHLSVVKTVDVVDVVAAAAVDNTEELNETYESEEYEEESYGMDYTEVMETEYQLGTGYDFSSRDAYILACIVSAEAGDQGYDCQLAVANVVIHRALSLGGYPGSIEEVVYAPYQFEPAYTTMQDFIANGPQEDAVQASQDALNGIDNVPGYEHFCYFTIMDDYLDCAGGVQIGSEWFYY